MPPPTRRRNNLPVRLEGRHWRPSAFVFGWRIMLGQSMSSTADTPRRPLFDPETVPHDPAFDDPLARGPALGVARLRPSALRRRFATPLAWQPELRADPRLFLPDMEPRPAAVLVPLIVRGNDVHVLLTQRTTHLNDHAGQISFPGGSVEEHDTDPVATAD